MSTKDSVLAYEFSMVEIKRLLSHYAIEKGARHTPNAKNVKSVMMALGIRQRLRPTLHQEIHVVNESIPQLSKNLDLKKGTVDDILAFLTWAGICQTIRKGGGRGKNPTVRRLEIQDYGSGYSKHGVGESSDRVGISVVHNGERGIHDGELPDTPIIQPSSKPVCEPIHFTNTCESGYEIEKLIEAYGEEFEQDVVVGVDIETIPELAREVEENMAMEVAWVGTEMAESPKNACLKLARAIAGKYTS
jgi:hypothetical protein